MYGLFLGSVERKFPRDTYPNAKQQAKVAANKAGLNARQRLQATVQQINKSQEKAEPSGQKEWHSKEVISRKFSVDYIEQFESLPVSFSEHLQASLFYPKFVYFTMYF